MAKQMRGQINLESVRRDSMILKGIDFLDLSCIKSDETRDFCECALMIAPQDFWVIPASSSGKYHPDYAQGEEGLLRHTKACVMIAQELFPLYNFSQRKQDLILTALMLHDIMKPSKTHPIEVKLQIESLNDHRDFDEVIDLIESHMGQWDNYGKLPRPKSSAEKFVHLCDYLASRKLIEINFKL